MSLFRELKRREVFRVAAIYVAVAWGVTEILVEVIDRFGLASELATLVVILFVLGFPVAMFLAWVFDITPQGVRRTEIGGAKSALSVGLAFVFLFAGTAGLFYFLDSRTAFTPEDALILPYRSIAVLPFEAADAQDTTKVLSVGIVDEILARLVYVPDVKVVARASSHSEQLHGLSAQAIGKRLGVRRLLQGSVRRSGPKLRVSLAMVDSVSGYQTWAHTLDSDYAEIFRVPAELAGLVVEALEIDVSAETLANVTYAQPTDARAYDLYLLGSQRLRDMIDDNSLLAVRYFEEALAIDPDFAKAWAGLSTALSTASLFMHIPPEQAFSRAREASLRAIALDESSVEARLALSELAFNENDWAMAGRELRRALSIAPGSVDALTSYAYYLSFTGEHDSGIATMRRVAELDPLTADWQLQIGWMLNFAGRFEEALAQFEYVLGLMPDNPTVYMELAWPLVKLGRIDEALAAVDRSLGLAPEDLLILGGNAWTLAMAGEETRALEMLQRIHEGENDGGYADPIADAVIYAALGQNQIAIDFVEQLLADGAGSAMFLPQDWGLDPLRDDPRFQALLDGAGLAAWSKRGPATE